MNRLARLQKPLQDMSAEEMHELIRHIRADRRLTKERPSVKKTTARTKDKDNRALLALLNSLSPEEREALLNGELGDDAGNGSTAGEDQGKE